MSKRTQALLGVAVVGLLIGIGIGALVWSGSSGNGSSTTSAATDTRPITLPATLAGFSDITRAIAARHPKASVLDQQRAHQAQVRADTQAAYTRAFAGAGVGYRQYADSSLQKSPYVIAVRASAPGMTLGPVVRGSFLGLATPDREVKTIGSVSCQILWSPPTVAGQTPPPSSERIAGCQRSDHGVTVFTGGGAFAGPADLQTLANLTNAAWSAASGG